MIDGIGASCLLEDNSAAAYGNDFATSAIMIGLGELPLGFSSSHGNTSQQFVLQGVSAPPNAIMEPGLEATAVDALGQALRGAPVPLVVSVKAANHETTNL